MTDISKEELEALAKAAEAAKQRAIRRAKETVFGDPTLVKKEVTPEEYKLRYTRIQKRDATLVKEVKQSRIDKSLAEWKTRVGKTFADATVDLPEVQHRVSRIGDSLGGHKTSLIFHGRTGVGKSWMAYAYINAALKAGKVSAGQIKFDTETGLLSKIASGGFKRAELLDELLNPRYQIYFVDDVGQGYFSREDSRTEVWYELIDHIYTHQLTLLITTNLPITDQGLGNWIGFRAYDRLVTMVGRDGVIEPSKVNRRAAVAEANEDAYKRQNRG
jgi:DNA replication protein DnaC